MMASGNSKVKTQVQIQGINSKHKNKSYNSVLLLTAVDWTAVKELKTQEVFPLPYLPSGKNHYREVA